MIKSSAKFDQDPRDLAFELLARAVDDDHEGALAEGQYRVTGESEELVIQDKNNPDGLAAKDWLIGFSLHALPGITLADINELIEEVDTVAWHAQVAGTSVVKFASTAVSNSPGDLVNG